ncbi:MAG: phosphoserine phosphatase [Candidatus Muproteobacteria bacterium RBG_16_65_31]|uniref:Histidinol-phosphatase n=2 Tax=Candidatus Muproteobacteria TaxID=1817795 RepID=A0A1F6TID7_9PROT|nr:MAG: phosphoserine phosphatase [Candidatus Muproteobacteria bacterium RBG_16_65_31]OGI50397.1 MAG: phosphoserine phosphatase [Candidatus Muproteobacteria bacterium RIFCSPHIGHO2_02_FULL_65_16]
MSLAIFDLDHTLLRGDSDYAWGQFLVENHVVDGEAYRRENERYYAQYHAGTLDIMEFLAFALRPLARHDRAALEAWRRQYMQAKVQPMITPQARALVEEHRARGDTLVVITATNSFVTGPIAAAFGIPHLIATEPEVVNDRFTGKVSGTPCYRDGKVTRLKAWLAERGEALAGSWFYSDSHNDLPLLGIVDHPVAVNPDDTLRAEARARGWPIITLD